MGEPALKGMTIDEFIAWAEPIPDIRYELVHGEPRAKPLNWVAHSLIASNLYGILHERLRYPFRGLIGCGVRFSDRNDTLYSPDLTVTATPFKPHSYWLDSPVLIVEVLAEDTAAYDRGTKVPDYMQMPSVQEILLVDSREPHVQLWRRDGRRWIVEDFTGDTMLPLMSIDAELPLTAVYEGVAF